MTTGDLTASVDLWLRRRGHGSLSYRDVLAPEDARGAWAVVEARGAYRRALPLLAWLASHPSTPEDVLRGLAATDLREVLFSLALNRRLPRDLRARLLAHPDPELQAHAHHVQARLGLDRPAVH